MDDVGLEVRDVGGPGGEHRDAALERLERPEAERRRHRAGQRAVDRDDEVGDEPAVRVEVRVDVVPVADEQDAPVDRDRRYRRAARVEEDDVRLALGREAGACDDVRDEHLAREPAARTAAADRRHAGDGRDLEVVRGGVPAGARELDEVVDGRPVLDHLGLGRAAAAHRDHDDVVLLREQRGEVRRQRGLPHALAGADHGDRRQVEVGVRRAGRSGSRRRCTESPAASACDAQRKRSSGPSTGSSDRSTTASAAPKPETSGTP